MVDARSATRRLAIPRAVAVVVATLVMVAAAPLPALARRLPMRVYTVADGLARDSVRCVVEDSRGFLWFCTDEGLSRFDGTEFRNYGERDGLSGHAVRTLLEEGEGRYWVGTGTGLFRFDPRPQAGRLTFERIPLPFAPPSPHGTRVPSPESLVTVVHRDPAGRLWVGSTRGAARLERDEPGTWRAAPVQFVDEDDRPLEVVVRGIIDDGAGGVWIGTRWWGVFRIEKPAFTAADGDAPPPTLLARRWITLEEMGGDLRALRRDRSGRLWAGSVHGLIELRPDEAARRLRRGASYTREHGLPNTAVQAIAESSDGRLLLATDAGAALVERAGEAGVRIAGIDRSDGLPGGIQVSVAEDREGNLWVGSAGAGVARIAPHGFSTYDASDGLVVDRAVGALLDVEGRPCFVTRLPPARLVVSCFDGERFEASEASLPPAVTSPGWSTVRPVLATAEGWWIATENGLAFVPGDGRLPALAGPAPARLFTTADGLSGQDVLTTFLARDGTLWVGTSMILPGESSVTVRLAGAERFTSIPRTAPLPSAMAVDFAEDDAGGIWIAFADGTLVRWRTARFEWIADASTLGVDAATLQLDPAGRLWVVGVGGVARIDDPTAERPTWTHIGPADGLSSIAAVCAVFDRRGRVAIGTGRGVDILDPGTGALRHLGRDDGLGGNEVRQCLADRDGNLWFAFDGSVSRLPQGDDPPPRPPRLLIDAIRVSGTPWPISALGETAVGGVVLEPGQRHLAIDLVGFGSARGGQPRFEHRLLGSGDDAWSAPQVERTVSYAALAPGRYRFEARAVDAMRQVSATGVSVELRVVAPVWQRGWFWATVLVTAAAALALGQRLRAQRVLQLERLRTRIAMDLHDELGSGLGGIGIMSGLLGEESLPADERRGLAKRVAATASELGLALTDIVWALRPGNTQLDHLAYFLAERGGRLLAGEARRFETRFPESFPELELSLAVQHTVQRIGLEALHNAAKHAGAERVVLALLPAAAGRWTLSVEDDGVGIAEADVLAVAEGDAATHGHGLPGMRRRAAEIGAELAIGRGVGARGTRVALTFDPRGRPA